MAHGYGKELPESASGNQLGIRDFIKFHDDREANGQSTNERLEGLNTALGGAFHGMPSVNKSSSWERRRVFASRHHLNMPDNREPLFYWAGLIRFVVTDSINPNLPLIFYINNPGFDTLWIAVDEPSFEFPVVETEIRIGRQCQ